jgi:hypothetical protein
MNTGVHGTNDLNPQTSYKIYQCYVMPRLLYGIAILPLNQKKNILILVEEKKKSDSDFLSNNLMLNVGEKKIVL